MFVSIRALLFFSFICGGMLLGSIYHVPIEGTIDNGLPIFVERSIKNAEKDKSELIIFEVNTFGGRVDAATKIKDLILNTSIPTVAFINKRAISAGALISLSCKTIYMCKGGVIGATTVVNDKGEKQSEKAQSYMRAEMASTAERNGRRQDIARAMVDASEEIKGISKRGKLLTLTTKEALKYGYCDTIIDDFDEILQLNKIASETRIVKTKETISEKIVRFLTLPYISSLLMTIGFLGIIIEIKTPGLGLSGLIGIIALSLFFGSHYIIDLANNLELAIFIVGIILIVMEVFIIPGFGLTGILGIICVSSGIFMALLDGFPAMSDILQAGSVMSVSLILIVIGTYLIMKYLPSFPIFKNIILIMNHQTGTANAGLVEEYKKNIGKKGRTVSVFHPSGKVNISGNIYQAMSISNQFIDKNVDIVVEDVKDGILIVSESKI